MKSLIKTFAGVLGAVLDQNAGQAVVVVGYRAHSSVVGSGNSTQSANCARGVVSAQYVENDSLLRYCSCGERSGTLPTVQYFMSSNI